MALYDFRVRLKNGITAVVCAGDRDEAAALVKGILGRFGGTGAKVAAVARLRKRDADATPGVVTASDLRRFVANRKAARNPRRPLPPYSARYQRKKGPYGQRPRW